MENDGRSSEKNLYEVSLHSLFPMLPIRVYKGFRFWIWGLFQLSFSLALKCFDSYVSCRNCILLVSVL